MNDDVSDDDGSIRVLVRISISFSHHLSSICSFLHRFYSLSLSLSGEQKLAQFNDLAIIS